MSSPVLSPEQPIRQLDLGLKAGQPARCIDAPMFPIVGHNDGNAATRSMKYAIRPRRFKVGERSIEKGPCRKHENVLPRESAR